MRRPVGVKWICFGFCWTKVFSRQVSHGRHASVRTLEGRFISPGACWAFSVQPVLPSVWRPVILETGLLISSVNVNWASRETSLPLNYLRFTVIHSSSRPCWELGRQMFGNFKLKRNSSMLLWTAWRNNFVVAQRPISSERGAQPVAP